MGMRYDRPTAESFSSSVNSTYRTSWAGHGGGARYMAGEAYNYVPQHSEAPRLSPLSVMANQFSSVQATRTSSNRLGSATLADGVECCVMPGQGTVPSPQFQQQRERKHSADSIVAAAAESQRSTALAALCDEVVRLQLKVDEKRRRQREDSEEGRVLQQQRDGEVQEDLHFFNQQSEVQSDGGRLSGQALQPPVIEQRQAIQDDDDDGQLSVFSVSSAAPTSHVHVLQAELVRALESLHLPLS